MENRRSESRRARACRGFPCLILKRELARFVCCCAALRVPSLYSLAFTMWLIHVSLWPWCRRQLLRSESITSLTRSLSFDQRTGVYFFLSSFIICIFFSSLVSRPALKGVAHTIPSFPQLWSLLWPFLLRANSQCMRNHHQQAHLPSSSQSVRRENKL